MNTISKLYEVDPTFREVISALYGDAVDTRELWDLSKAMPGSSDAHVSGTKNDKKKAAIAGGLVFGTAAEGAAVSRAGQHAFPKASKAMSRGLAPLGEKIPKVKLPKAKGLGNGKGEFALQAANMGVGLLAARELFKKPKNNGQKTQAVAKRFRPVKDAVNAGKLYGHLNAQATARGRNAIRTTGTGPGDVFHAMPEGAGRPGRVVNRKAKTTAKDNAVTRSNIEAAKKGRRGVLVAVAAGSGAGGYKAGQRRPNAVRPAAVSKSTEVDMIWNGEISKVDTDKRQVFGWCSLTKVNGEHVVDLQGDYIPLEEIEKSAYKYVIESRKGGDMHKRVAKADQPLHTSDLIESFVVTPEKLRQMGLDEDAMPHGWWVGFKVNDDAQWQMVKNGERTGFSIHGSGTRVEKAL